MHKATRIIFAFLLILMPFFAAAQELPEGPLVTVQLIAEKDAITPGAPFTVALRQEITPGWHTYWSNPGDTGLATTVTWQLPEGFTASDLQFPTPHRQPTGGLVNYGYENSVMIFTTITPPANVTVGQEVTLQGKASWLVCKESCIPESASFLLTLPVKEQANPSAWDSAFTAARAQLPKTHTSTQNLVQQGDMLVVTLDPLPLAADQMPEEAYFFPHESQLIEHNAEQKLTLDGRKLTLTIPCDKTRTKPIDKVTGDVWLRTMTGEQSFVFDTTLQTTPPPVAAQITAPSTTEPLKGEAESMSLLTALISAFFGGILLNLMPCVFPVLSLKALGLVKKAHHERRHQVIIGGIAYTCGVLASFALLATTLIALKATGQHIGWGIQLQSPVFVAAMAVLLFTIGYMLSGAVTLGAGLIGIGSAWANKHGLAGSFFTGALAVIVATPCTAPFMGGAIFYGLTQSPVITFLVLSALGLGLALPYLLLTLFPRALKFLPRPGIWMEHFKQFLAFPMLAASIWMIWVLAQQTGANGVGLALCSILSLAFGFWLFNTTHHRPKSGWQTFKKLLSLLMIVLAVCFIIQQPRPRDNLSVMSNDRNYEPWSAEKLAELRAAGKPVFVNMTAAWCISCLANDKATLSTSTIRNFFTQNKITYLKGDWTNYDDAITQYLKEFGRSGVPIYVFYPADRTKPAIVLPQVLTSSIVIDTITPALGAQP